MTLTELLKFIWNGVDIPVTKDEIQHTVNVSTWALKNALTNDKDCKELNDLYKSDHEDHRTFNIEIN